MIRRAVFPSDSQVKNYLFILLDLIISTGLSGCKSLLITQLSFPISPKMMAIFRGMSAGLFQRDH